jgi:predicted CXXCH cytochrome family protein
VAAIAIVRSARKRRIVGWTVALVLFGGTALAQSMWMAVAAEREHLDRQLTASLPTKGRPGGYVSSDQCRACHPTQYSSWHRSYHRTMTQVATPATVRGDFNNVALQYDDGRTYTLKRRGDEFLVDISGIGERRIAMMTGSHHMQAYWMSTGIGNGQYELPFTYLFDDKRWVKRRDVFLVGPEYPKSQELWNATCVECHATGGQPSIDLQTHVPSTRVGELGIACESCHGPGEEHVNANLNPARRYWLHWRGKGDPTIVNPARLPAVASAQTCGQCHGIGCNLAGWNEHGLAYRPGEDLEAKKPFVRVSTASTSPCAQQIAADKSFFDSRYWKDGMPRTSGREMNSLLESPCFKGGKLSCISCHSSHDSDPNDQLARHREGNEACLQCHPQVRAKLTQHTHHPASSPGSLCYNCHMPNTTYGLLTAMRSHTVTSPDVGRDLKAGRPNACNLCHLDKTLSWTAKSLHTWYGTPEPKLDTEQQTVSSSILDLLRGDAGKRALIAWSMGWGPAVETAGKDWLPPYLAWLFEDPYAAVRYMSGHSIEKLPGYTELQFDYVGTPEARAKSRQQAMDIWEKARRDSNKGRPGSERGNAEVLLNGNADKGGAGLRRDVIDRLARDRDDKQMFLAE